MRIHSTPTCPRCKTLMAALDAAGVSYEKGTLDSSAISDCLMDTGQLVNAAPLVLNGLSWIFADDLFTSEGYLVKNWLEVLEGKPEVKQFSGVGGKPSEKVQESSRIWGER